MDVSGLLAVVEAQQKSLAELRDEVIALRTAQQVLLELMLGSQPAIKQQVALGLGQVLARPELTPLPALRELYRQLEEVARRPSRTTPEGRREWISVVPTAPSAPPDEQDS